MHWLDLLIIGVIAWVTFRALSVGLIREVVTLVALVTGTVLAGQFYQELAADIEFLTDDLQTRELAAFISIFAGVFVIGQIIGHVMRRTAAMLLLGPFDRLGGATFGFAKGLLLVEVLLLAAVTFPISGDIDSAVDDSALAPFFLDGIPVLLKVLPTEFRTATEGLGTGALPITASLTTSILIR